MTDTVPVPIDVLKRVLSTGTLQYYPDLRTTIIDLIPPDVATMEPGTIFIGTHKNGGKESLWVRMSDTLFNFEVGGAYGLGTVRPSSIRNVQTPPTVEGGPVDGC